MFGMRYLKTEPTTYVLLYRGGKVVKEGQGLSFFYFAPNSTIVAVPSGSVDLPFILRDSSADFQDVTVQGSFTYRISDPKGLAGLLNFSIRQSRGKCMYESEDPEKLPKRITNVVQVLARAEIQKRNLKDCLKEADQIGIAIFGEIIKSPALASLGIEVINFAILALKPTPETSKALEAEMREALLGQADAAIYVRRNAAIENERKIKENELQTELTVTLKQREIREKEMETKIAVEEQRKKLIAVNSDNVRQEADARGYATAATIRPFTELDPKVLQILASANMQPKQLISTAFKELAENASNIGNLNITPDLLSTLLEDGDRPKAMAMRK